MPMLTKGTWVVVADAEKAVVYENVGDVRKPELRRLQQIDAPETFVATDRPGRMPDVGPNQRSALEQPDYARLAGEGLAADLAAVLARKLVKGAFERLVIVAPPQVLGAIRDELSDEVRARVLGEIPKTLTNHPVPKIGPLVAEALDGG